MNPTIRIGAAAIAAWAALGPVTASARSFVNDEAGMFSREAVTRANADIRREYERTHRPIYVHTVDETIDDVRTDAQRDYRSQHVGGIEIYVVKNEHRDQVVAASNLEARSEIPTIHRTFEAGMRGGDADRALANAVAAASQIVVQATVGSETTTASQASSDRTTAAATGGGFGSKNARAATTIADTTPAPVATAAPERKSSGAGTWLGIVLGLLGITAVGAILLRPRKPKPTPVESAPENQAGGGGASESGATPIAPQAPSTTLSEPSRPASVVPPYEGGYDRGYGGGATTIIHENNGGMGGAMTGALLGSALAGGGRSEDRVTVINEGGQAAAPAATAPDSTGGTWTGRTEGESRASDETASDSATDTSGGSWSGGAASAASAESDTDSSGGGWSSSASSTADDNSSSSGGGWDSSSGSDSSSSDSGGGFGGADSGGSDSGGSW